MGTISWASGWASVLVALPPAGPPIKALRSRASENETLGIRPSPALSSKRPTTYLHHRCQFQTAELVAQVMEGALSELSKSRPRLPAYRKLWTAILSNHANNDGYPAKNRPRSRIYLQIREADTPSVWYVAYFIGDAAIILLPPKGWHQWSRAISKAGFPRFWKRASPRCSRLTWKMICLA